MNPIELFLFVGTATVVLLFYVLYCLAWGDLGDDDDTPPIRRS